MQFELRHVVAGGNSEEKKAIFHKTTGSGKEMVSDFLVRISREMNLESAKIIKLIPSLALKKVQLQRPLVLDDFKLKKDKDGWIRLPVIGEKKGIAEVEIKIAREAEFKNAVEDCYVGNKETPEELNRSWQNERFRISDTLIRNACELCIRGDCNGLARLLTLTWFKTEFLPQCFEFACEGGSVECFLLLFDYMNQKIDLYKEQLVAHQIVQTYSSTVAPTTTAIDQALFHNRCQNFGLYIPWKECFRIAFRRGYKNLVETLVPLSHQTGHLQPYFDQETWKRSILNCVHTADVQLLRILLENIAPLLFPEGPWPIKPVTNEMVEEDEEEEIRIWENDVLRHIFYADLPLSAQLLYEHKFPAFNYQTFVHPPERIGQRMFAVFWDFFRNEDQQNGNQVICRVYQEQFQSRNLDYLQFLHRNYGEIRKLYVQSLVAAGGIDQKLKECIFSEDFTFLHFMCSEVLQDHLFDISHLIQFHFQFDVSSEKQMNEVFNPLSNTDEEEVKVNALTYCRFLLSEDEQKELLNQCYNHFTSGRTRLCQSSIQSLNATLILGIVKFSTLSKWLTKDHTAFVNEAYNDFFLLYFGYEKVLHLLLSQVNTLQPWPKTLLNLVFEYVGAQSAKRAGTHSASH